MGATFLLTSLIVVLLPGAGTLYTLGAALGRGTRAGVLAAFACTIGIVPHLLAALTGLAALLQASGVAFEVVRYAGVAYLLYLAWARGTTPGRCGSRPHGRGARRGVSWSTASPSTCSIPS